MKNEASESLSPSEHDSLGSTISFFLFFLIETRDIHPPENTPDGPAHGGTLFLFLSYTFFFWHSRPSSHSKYNTEDKLKGYIVHLEKLFFQDSKNIS